ncbi:hypothetical protein [Virgisporangium ochraceum]|uniref:hypothetical protein n=1 Tax=Virgisporangium ochraceum TaxID=65505 RepID=UPI001941431D|nr:hypothetical protein [Virgisporangium ochraceum]
METEVLVSILNGKGWLSLDFFDQEPSAAVVFQKSTLMLVVGATTLIERGDRAGVWFVRTATWGFLLPRGRRGLFLSPDPGRRRNGVLANDNSY